MSDKDNSNNPYGLLESDSNEYCFHINNNSSVQNTGQEMCTNITYLKKNEPQGDLNSQNIIHNINASDNSRSKNNAKQTIKRRKEQRDGQTKERHDVEEGNDEIQNKKSLLDLLHALTAQVAELKSIIVNLNSEKASLIEENEQLKIYANVNQSKDGTDITMSEEVSNQNEREHNFPSLPMVESRIQTTESCPKTTLKSTKSTLPKPGIKKKKENPPVFICYNINQKEMTNNLQQLLKHKNFVFNIINKNVTHISSCVINDYNNIKTYLIDSKVNFYTYTPNEE